MIVLTITLKVQVVYANTDEGTGGLLQPLLKLKIRPQTSTKASICKASFKYYKQ